MLKHFCCVFWPAFGCCTHPKAGWTTFFSRFQPFLIILNLFQLFHVWDQQKTCENEQKKWYLSTAQSWSTCKSWSTPWGVTSKNVENGWKKVVQPAFGCAQHPKAGQSTQHTIIFKIKFLDFLFRHLLLLDTFFTKIFG